mgnify:CR=1 FL=1
MSKTQRLLHSFKLVKLLPEHLNHGDEGPSLRGFGMAPSVATALIRWGETQQLVCTFENARGRSNNTYSWQSAFLKAAVASHLRFFGTEGRSDIPQQLLDFVAE